VVVARFNKISNREIKIKEEMATSPVSAYKLRNQEAAWNCYSGIRSDNLTLIISIEIQYLNLYAVIYNSKALIFLK